jgi:hypothetical protein
MFFYCIADNSFNNNNISFSMDGLTHGEIKKLRFTFIISFLINIIFSSSLYLHFRSEYYQGWFYHVMLYFAIFMILLWVLWIVIYSFYIYHWEKIYPSTKIITLMIVCMMFFITAHQIFFRNWIEREIEPFFLEIGHLEFTKPKLINKSYYSLINFSFKNNINYPLDYVSFNLKFTNWTVKYNSICFYPNERIIDEPSGYNEIYIRWKRLLPYENSFLTCNLSWDKNLGGNIPINFSQDKTFIDISGYYIRCLPNEIN